MPPKTSFSDLPKNMQYDILQNTLGIDSKPSDLTESQLNTLNALCPEELWNCYLEWNGLVNWAGPLVRAHAEIVEEPVSHDRFSNLPASFQNDLAQHKFDCDCKQLTPDQLESMNSMSPQKMWASYLDYNGIIGWADTLDQAHQAVFAPAPSKTLQAEKITDNFQSAAAYIFQPGDRLTKSVSGGLTGTIVGMQDANHVQVQHEDGTQAVHHLDDIAESTVELNTGREKKKTEAGTATFSGAGSQKAPIKDGPWTNEDLKDALFNVGFEENELNAMVDKLADAPLIQAYLVDGMITSKMELEGIMKSMGVKPAAKAKATSC